MKWKACLQLFAFASLFFFSACAQTPRVYESPQGYELNAGEPLYLPDALHELSGIAFPKESDELIFAVEDERGLVYFFPPDDPKLQQVKFGKKGDYEGIAISNGYVAVLESNGTIYTFPLEGLQQGEMGAVKMAKNRIPKGEYESLAAAPADSLLYVLCKKCGVDKGTNSTTGYRLRLSKEGEVTNIGTFEIDEAQIDRWSSLKGKRFRPSALTQNPETNQWFILSSINALLVVANENWEVVGAYPLDPARFNQPEAIAFDRNNNLYIGNEGGDVTKKGTLFKFNRIP